MKVVIIGLDLAKHIFQAHGVDAEGRPLLRKRLRRSQVARFFANLPPCVVGMEACCGAHYWNRVIGRLGHSVRLIAPQFVKTYVKSNKNDANDAEAICEAAGRPQMRFVPAKSVEQQDSHCTVCGAAWSARGRNWPTRFVACWPNTGSCCRNMSANCGTAYHSSWRMQPTS